MESLFERYCEIIPEYSAFLESLKQPLPVHLRVNRLKIEPALLASLLEKKGIQLTRVSERDESLLLAQGSFSVGNLLEYYLGYFHPQALTSCLVSLAFPVRPDSLVLDMCASPGGKTSHLAQLMNNTGLIIANEPYPRRQIPLAHTLGRLGVLNTVLTTYQAQEFPLRTRFDYVLADVPCSGEGRFRTEGKAPWYGRARGKGALPDLQKKIIIRGFDLLKEGGEMVYATCTYNPDENEAVVDFLLRNREAKLLPVEFGLPIQPGLSEWRKEPYDRQLRRAARFYPHQVNSVGFFMARIGRRL